jgi:hypothetical protein
MNTQPGLPTLALLAFVVAAGAMPHAMPVAHN